MLRSQLCVWYFSLIVMEGAHDGVFAAMQQYQLHPLQIFFASSV